MRLLPPISSVELADGPFTVFVVVDDLQHYGVLEYDDNRDTTPDREVDSTGLAAFEFTIAYDPSLIEVREVRSSMTALGRTGRDFQCLQPQREIGRFSFGCISTGPEPPGPQGTMTLASVVLQPLEAGSSPLGLEADLAGPLGSDPATEVYGGIVQVRGRGVRTEASPGQSPTLAAANDTPAGVLPEATPDSTSTAASLVELEPLESPADGVVRLPADGTAASNDPNAAKEPSETSEAWLDGPLTWGVVAAIVGAIVGIGAGAAVMARRR